MSDPVIYTPNVVVANPTVRKVANIIIGTALIVFPTATVLDASSADLDFALWLIPATAVTSFLAGIFGLAVTVPNVAKPNPNLITVPRADYIADQEGRHALQAIVDGSAGEVPASDIPDLDKQGE